MNSLRSKPLCLYAIAAGSLLAFQCAPAFAQLEDAGFSPGLLARYETGSKHVERIDPDVSFVWTTSAPDRRLPEGPFQATWTGQLLVRQEATYRFHAYVEGHVAMELDGQEVLEGRSDQPNWITGDATEVGFGIKSLKVTFHKTHPTARVQLFWSSDRFPLEPLPAHLLFREEPHTRLSDIEQGRVLFDAHRCNRCHRRENDPLSPPAPDLTHVAAGTDSSWLIDKLHAPGKTDPNGKMPAFGFTEDEARAIVAFLVRQSEPVKLDTPKPPKDDAKERRQGEVLLRSVGCLACHRVGELGNDGPYGGGDLTQIGRKRSRAWLETWLREPQRLNADHRMPVFNLDTNQRRQLALALVGDSEPDSSLKVDAKLAERGRKLVEQARCAACHRIPGVEYQPANLPDLSQPIDNESKSCLAEKPDRRNYRPSYRDIDHGAVAAFLRSRTGKLSPESTFAHGTRLLEQRNCVACHERDGSKGLVSLAGRIARVDDELRGESQVLIPPPLTAIGDKLPDAALLEAVSGKQKQRRLHWLRVQMPRFEHCEEDQAALAAYIVGHDRIPDGAPVEQLQPAASNGEAISLIGHELVGPKGFSCVACHQVGSFEPKNVALGTRGSDLLLPGKRMRREFFLRWTRSPLRIVPGIEMPSYERPVPELLDGDVDRQLAAIWDALNDPNFVVPTDPSSVEQFLVVKSDGPARIVRDVFTVTEGDKTVPVSRALAVGFNNGHNLLFDLDTFALRQWTFGDFARQRSVGKSWYWDMAGVPVVKTFDNQPDIVIRRAAKLHRGEIVNPILSHGRVGRLIEYARHEDGVRLVYDLDFQIDGRLHPLRIQERIVPIDHEDGRTHWRRAITAEGVPEGYEVLVSLPDISAQRDTALGSPIIGPVGHVIVGIMDPQFVPLFGPGKKRGAAEIVLEYTCRLARPPLELQPRPAVRSVTEKITSAPGFDGVRLPLPTSIMPTAIAWNADGTLAFTSLKGQVYFVKDTDGDGVEDQLHVFEEGLAAPFGLIADGDDLFVSHKPELLRLKDTDGDGQADRREVIATGWGYNDNYHDWTCGIARDSAGNMYVGLGSDYAQKDRPKNYRRWRGKVLQISPQGEVTPIANGLRYPMGLVVDAHDRLFVSDQQGVQNTFNEINLVTLGKHYGVPSRDDLEEHPDAPETPPAVQVPHPWTRSVCGLFMLPDDFPIREFAGHGVGCEYNNRFLIRYTTQQVGELLQGATYELTRSGLTGDDNFLGPMCGAVAPNGDIYIGSMQDSGWTGGRNMGTIARLRPNGRLPLGIRELRAVTNGFEIEFTGGIDPSAAAKPENYSISGYTRVWQGSYATPDSGRHNVTVQRVDILDDQRTVRLHVDGRREGHVYEVNCGNIGPDAKTALFPATGHYTLHRIPRDDD